jgi:hypothetical protein
LLLGFDEKSLFFSSIKSLTGAGSQVGALAERLRDPQKGVSVQDRRYFFRTYPKTFVGKPKPQPRS